MCDAHSTDRAQRRPTSLPSRRARVAQPRLRVIPGGDGVPSTHTPLAARPDREFTDGPPGTAPLPFAASSNISAVLIVAAMSAVVTVMSVVAILRLYADHPAQNGIAVGFRAVAARLGWPSGIYPPWSPGSAEPQNAAHRPPPGAQLASTNDEPRPGDTPRRGRGDESMTPRNRLALEDEVDGPFFGEPGRAVERRGRRRERQAGAAGQRRRRRRRRGSASGLGNYWQ